ncbi:MAG TPA: hypothetical protein ENG14_02590, partial [Thermodesulforhabdus norvegica]|nr:hypothetical protein [Thermodesulforhabdus norvegica]
MRYLAIAGVGGSTFAFLFATVGLVMDIPYFKVWYYCWAWWSLIIGAQSWLCLSGKNSLLYENPKRFFALAAVSIPFWVFFEIVNFRLLNWRYVGLPESLSVRWAGYTLGYATVLPAIETAAAFLRGYSLSLSLPSFAMGFLKTLGKCPRPFLGLLGIFLFMM